MPIFSTSGWKSEVRKFPDSGGHLAFVNNAMLSKGIAIFQKRIFSQHSVSHDLESSGDKSHLATRPYSRVRFSAATEINSCAQPLLFCYGLKSVVGVDGLVKYFALRDTIPSRTKWGRLKTTRYRSCSATQH